MPQAVIRGDNASIFIDEGTNIQDGAIIHADPNVPVNIGKQVTIAHRAVVHGCSIGNNTVIGIGAVVLNNAVIGNNCIIAAHSLILENMIIPDGSLVVGLPGKVKRQLTAEEINNLS